MDRKHKYFVILLVYEVLLGYVAVILNFYLYLYLALSWYLPALFFIFQIKTFSKHLLLPGIFYSIFVSFAIDYLGHYTRAWEYWNNSNFAVTGIKIDEMPIESILWAYGFWIFTVGTYEYFFDKHRSHKKKPSELYLKLFVISITGIILYALKTIGRFEFDLMYVCILIFMGAYALIVISRTKLTFSRLALFGVMSLIFGVIIEVVSLRLNYWVFPLGSVIKDINMFGVIYPIEEFFWWIVLPIAIIATYELFIDTGD